MNEIVVAGQTEMSRILQAAAVEKPLPLPFESRIFLASCTVCGMSLVDGFNEAAGSLSAGDRLALKRDGSNAFDKLTIDVLAPS
ncbi:MAG: hypothetical protein LBK67_08780, partial [Coriobacteriales bacterium]|nr:hypothetical protein [Coriobacteriales bacterium]